MPQPDALVRKALVCVPRASLQLDETIALYVGRLFDREEIVGLVNNKHPMVPLSTMEAGFRLMLHGLADRRAEQSHSTRF